MNKLANSIDINVTSNTKGAQTNLNAVASIVTKLNNDLKKLNAALDSTDTELDNTAKSAKNDTAASFSELSKQINGLEKTVSGLGSTIKGVKTVAAGVLSALGITELTKSIGESINSALDYASSVSETESLLSSIYDTSVSEVISWADNTSKAYGLTALTAKNYVSTISAMLLNMGIESEDTVKTMSVNYAKLAGDLASAFNMNAEDTFNSLSSAVSGSTESVRKFGLILTEANLNEYLLSKGIETSFSALDEQNKQLVRYAYIMEQTSDIHGDFSRTSDGFANQTRQLSNSWQEFLTLLGQYALPIIKPVIEWLAMAIEYAKAVVVAVADILGVESDVSSTSDNIKDNTSTILSDTKDTASAQNATTAAIKKTNAALKASVKLLDLYTLDFSSASSSASDMADTPISTPDLSNKLLSGIDYADPTIDLGVKVDKKAVEDIASTIAKIISGLQYVWDNFISNIINDIKENPFEKIFDLLFSVFSAKKALNIGKEALSNVISGLSSTDQASLNKLLGKVKGIATAALGVFTATLGGYNLGQVLAQIVTGQEVSIIDAFSGITELISGTIMAAAGGFAVGGPVGAAIGAVISLVTGGISAAIGYFNELDEVAKNTVIDILTTGNSFETLVSAATSLYDSEAANNLMQPAIDNLKQVQNDADTITNTTLPMLFAELQKDPANALVLDGISTQFNNLKTSVVNGFSELNNARLDTLSNTLQGLRTEFGLTSSEVDDLLASMKEVDAQTEEVLFSKWQDIFTRISLGEAVSDEEMSFYDSYSEKISGLSSAIQNTQAIIDEFNSMDLSTFAPTYQKLVDGYEGAVGTIDEELSKIEEYLSSGALTSEVEEYYNQRKIFYETLKETVTNTYSNAEVELLDALKTSLKDTSLEVFADTITQNLESVDLSALGDDFVSSLKRLTDEAFSAGEIEPTELLVQYKPMMKAFGESLGYDISTQEGQLKTAKAFSTYIEAVAMQANATETTDLGINMNFDVLASTGNFEVDFKAQSMYKNMEEQLNNMGLSATLTDTGVSVYLPTQSIMQVDATYDQQTVLSAAQAVKNGLNAGVTSEEAKLGEQAAADTVASDTTAAINTSLTSPDTVAKVSESMAGMVNSATAEEDAENKGHALATALIRGITTGLDESTKEGSALESAINSVIRTIENLAKSSLNSISSYINNFSSNLKSQVSGLGITDDTTISGVISILGTKEIKLPMLADGAVIPANNPFLAILGDQKSGMNVETPIYNINQAAYEGVLRAADQLGGNSNQQLNVQVFIGDRALDDEIIRVVTDNKLNIG